MTKCRCRNHRLPVEAGCRARTQRDLRFGLYASIAATTSVTNTPICYAARYLEKSVKSMCDKFGKRPSTIRLEKMDVVKHKGTNPHDHKK